MFHKGSKEKPRGIGFGGFTVSSKPKQEPLRPMSLERASPFSKQSGKSKSPSAGVYETSAFKRP